MASGWVPRLGEADGFSSALLSATGVDGMEHRRTSYVTRFKEDNKVFFAEKQRPSIKTFTSMDGRFLGWGQELMEGQAATMHGLIEGPLRLRQFNAHPPFAL
jgi:hypothetical protein